MTNHHEKDLAKRVMMSITGFWHYRQSRFSGWAGKRFAPQLVVRSIWPAIPGFIAIMSLAVFPACSADDRSGRPDQETADRQNVKTASGDYPCEISTDQVSFTTREGYEFAARIVAPVDESLRNRRGVLMIGGGVANDIDWTVPGSVEFDGKRQQLTISGKDHADAPLIAETLASNGFAVMHWTTIREDDPRRDLWPNQITPWPMEDLLRFSRSALSRFRETRLIDPDQVFLLGHSLGAVRSANIASTDERIRGLVLLAPAQLTRTSAADRGRNMHRQAATEFLQAADSNGDELCNASELRAWKKVQAATDHPISRQTFEQLDFDSDGQIRQWEVSAGFSRCHRSESDFDIRKQTRDVSGLPWTEDVLRARRIDTLILFGALDNAQSHHAPIFAETVRLEKLDHVAIRVVPAAGHQLGPEENDLVGPIGEESRKAILEWLRKHL